MSVTAVGVHEELGATVRQVLAQHASLEQTLRRLEEALGYDQAAWRRMAPDMELPGLAVPERLGGPASAIRATNGPTEPPPRPHGRRRDRRPSN